MKAGLLLFDLMDTLLTVEPAERPYWHLIGDLLEAEGVIAAAAFNERYRLCRERRSWADHRQREYPKHEVTLQERLASVAPGLAAQALDRVMAAYTAEYMRRSSPVAGVPEMLDAWGGRVRMGVVSNFFIAGMPRALLEHHGLIGYFGFVVDSAETGYRKPAREIFLCALEHGNVPMDRAADVLMIGDDLSADFHGARAAGLQAQRFAPDAQGDSGDGVIRRWREFRPSR